MKLSLSNPISFRPSDASLDQLIDGLSSKERGYDAVAIYSLSLTSDSFSISHLHTGERNGYTEEERKLIEQGMAIPVKEDESISIPAGTYEFEQLPDIFPENNLKMILLPYSGSCRTVYIRLYKESVIESVMQLFIS